MRFGTTARGEAAPGDGCNSPKLPGDGDLDGERSLYGEAAPGLNEQLRGDLPPIIGCLMVRVR